MAQRSRDLAQLGMLVLVVLAVSWAVSFAFDPERAGQPSMLEAIAGTYAVLTAAAVVYAVKTKRLGKWLIPGWGDVTRGFFCALVLFALAFGVVKLLTMHGSPRAGWMARLYLQLGDTRPLRHHQGWVGAGIAVMAAMEEIVWRGWVQSLLETLVGLRWAWVAAGVLYALVHVPTLWSLEDPTAGLNPVVVLGALGGGLLWSAMARVFGRLWPSIIAHALFTWAVLMMFRLWGPSV